MNRGFWGTLPKPFFILAPMYDVTDVAFRHVVSQCARPDVYFTEFVSTDGLSNPTGRQRLLYHLKKEDDPTPLVAQVFGANPDKFQETARLITALGFNGIDINMGCPKPAEMKGGACAALFRSPQLAKEIVEATWEGTGGTIPVSVKIRIGDTKIDWENWIATLLQAKPVNISIHLRTRKEMSKVAAHWELMPNIMRFIHEQTTPEERPTIVGNGDVLTRADGLEKAHATGCDGIMIGRGIFQDPWVFSPHPREHSVAERAQLLLLHAEQYEKHFTGLKPFEPLKRFYKIYLSGFEGAAELREALYVARNSQEIKSILTSHKVL